MIPDIDERRRALDPQRSFIVQAPAGSGKTTLLIQRFLLLLSTVERPEEILAITFTRKAAGQMRGRIIEALARAAAGEEAADDNDAFTLTLARKAFEMDRRLGWKILENPSRLNVQTIDSFCASIAARMPLLSRLGGRPAVTETADELYKEAALKTLEMVDDDGPGGEALRMILRRLDNSPRDLQKRLVAMLEKRDQWLRHVGGLLEGRRLREVLEGGLKRLIDDTLRRVRTLVPPSLEKKIVSSAVFAAQNLRSTNPESPVTVLSGLTAFPGPKAEDLPLWKALADLLLTKNDGWRSPRGVNIRTGFPATPEARPYREDFQELLGELSSEDELLEGLLAVRRLPGAHYSAEDWEAIEALLCLLPVAAAHLTEIFTTGGTVDFPALSMAAIEALGTDDTPTDIMLYLDNRLRHILVDEYQDTSWTQSTLLLALTRGWEPGDGRTLFLVGDPMQSIYLFRDAEVGLFLDAKTNGLGTVELEPVILKTNFRSQAKIVDWVNRTFAAAFPRRDEVFTGAVRYEPSRALKPPERDLDVSVTIFEGRDDLREASEAVRILKGIKEGETAAILGRSRSHLGAIVEELKRAGVDFKGEDLDPLATRPVVQDLLALERALSHPMDRVAWLAVLRARWCGLTLADMHRLCLGEPDAPLWRLMNDPERLKELSEDGRERLASLVERLDRAMALVGRVHPRRLLEGLWVALGGPACYDDVGAMDDADAFFGLLESLSRCGRTPDAALLESRLEGLYAAPGGGGENPVVVTTIHNAKGLEFDHVILPGVGKKPRGQEKRLLFWLERGEDLLLAPIEGVDESGGIYRYISDVWKEKEDLEKMRLFYVAATRARKGLYIFGHLKEGKPEPKSFLGSAPHLVEEAKVVEAEDRPERKRKARMRPLRLVRPFVMPDAVPPILSAAEEAASYDTRPVFDWAGEDIRRTGTVVHRYLWRIATEGLASWNEKRLAGERRCMEAMLRELGFGRDEAPEKAGRVVEILRRALTDERGRWILDSHDEGSAELPVTGVVDGRPVRVVIDRTFVDEQGRRWVIDYKTGIHSGGALRDFLDAERERYRAQLERYAAILRAGGEKRQIRCGLYYPALSGWVEW